MKSSDQLRRMVQLVPFLVANPGVSVSHAAEVFHTTPATILGDLNIIQYVGLPGGYTDDLIDVDLDHAREEGEIYISNADVLARPMTLTQDQATSLSVALLALVELGDAAATSALAKLTRACRGVPEGITVELASGDAEVRRRIMEACERRRVVTIWHRSASGVTEVTVEPARLRTDAGAVYLDAWSRRRQAWRSFHVARISRVEILDEPTPMRAGLDEATSSWFADTDTQLDITVGAQGRWVSEYYPTTAISEDDQAMQIQLPVGHRRWALALLLRLGDKVLDVAQRDLAAQAADEARRALAHYPAE